jgi:hypothetical protein
VTCKCTFPRTHTKFSPCGCAHHSSLSSQVHYEKGRPAGDAPGFGLSLSPRPTRNAAGMLTFASRFAVPPGKPSHRVASACCYAGFEPLHALAFRVHTHELGRCAHS